LTFEKLEKWGEKGCQIEIEERFGNGVFLFCEPIWPLLASQFAKIVQNSQLF
jgi:hypothetical protein